MYQKGIVIEKFSETEALVRTPSGDLKKVKMNGREYRKGDEILLYEKPITQKNTNRNRIFYITATAVITLFLVFFHIAPMNNKSVHASTIYVESRANIKVDLNQYQEVINITPLNHSASKVVQEIDWALMQLDDFIDIYFKEMKENGYLADNEKAVISVVSKEGSEKTFIDISKIIRENQFIKDHSVQILTLFIPEKVVKTADSVGSSPAKLIILLAAQSLGEKNIPSVESIKMVNATELLDKNPALTKILPSYSKKDLVLLVEQPLNTLENNPLTTIPSEPLTTARVNPSQSSENTQKTNKTNHTTETKQSQITGRKSNQNNSNSQPTHRDSTKAKQTSKKLKQKPNKELTNNPDVKNPTPQPVVPDKDRNSENPAPKEPPADNKPKKKTPSLIDRLVQLLQKLHQ